jgi:uncharacterized protein YdcH (DUF465 family)
MSDPSLESRYQALSKQVDVEEARRHPDPVALATMKKEKLALKDAIAHH